MALVPALKVDWNANGSFADTGEDVTARVIGFVEATRGRKLTAGNLDRPRPGRLVCFLNNESGDYSSFNSGSPIAGDVLPKRKVQLSAVNGGTSGNLWTGYLESIVPLPKRAGGIDLVRLTAVGAFGIAGEPEVALAMATNKGTGAAIDDILDAADWPAGDRSIDAGQTTMDRYWEDRKKALTALFEVIVTEGGFAYEDPDGKIVFEGRHARVDPTHATSQATFSDAPGAALSYRLRSGIVQEDPLKFIRNDFRATIQRYTVGSLAVLWTLSESGADSPSISPGQPQIFWAAYPNPDSAVGAESVNAWTDITTVTDVAANSQAGGGGSDLTSDIGIAFSKFGNSVKITLTNNHATLPAFITLLQARGTPVTADNPVSVMAEDTASQNTYGLRTLRDPAKFIPNTTEGQDWCNAQNAIWPDPLPFIAMTIQGHRDSAHADELITRALSERITVKADAAAGLGFDRDFFIEGMTYRIWPGASEVTYLLSDAVPFSDWWIIGSSELGINTRLYY